MCFRLSETAFHNQTFTFMIMLVPSDALKSQPFTFNLMFLKLGGLNYSRYI